MRALSLSIFLFSSIAQANGRMAGAFQIVEKPGDDKVLLVRTTFGVFSSTDRAAHWDWICEAAVGYGGKTVIEDPTIAVTTAGAQIIGVQRGLASSPTGCNWTYAFEGKPVIDVTVAKGIPGSAFAISAVAMGDGGSGPYATQVWRSMDDGKSFAPYLAALDPAVFPITIDVTNNFTYVTGERSRYGSASLFVNDGTGWVERPIPIAMTEMGAYIAAIDPKNDQRLYFRTLDANTGTSRILTTDDGGKNFTTRFTGHGVLTGFALSEDGTTIWVGGASDFVQKADTTTFQFQEVNGVVQPKCLGSFGNRLYACTNDGNFLDVSEDQGKTFAPLLAYCGLRGPLACPADSGAAVCAADWPNVMMGLGGPCAPDVGDEGGISDASSGDAAKDGGTNPPPKTGGCGCNETEPSSGAGLIGLGSIILAALLRARKSRRPPTRRRERRSAAFTLLTSPPEREFLEV